MGPRTKSWLSWSMKAAVSAIILFYIFTKIPFSDVIASVRATKVFPVVLGLLLGFLVRYAEASRMKILTDLQGMSFSTGHIYKINLMTSFYGMFLPGSLAGGAIRWYKLSRPDNKPSEAFISIAFNRWIHTTGIVLFGLIFWSLDWEARASAFIGGTFLLMLTVLFVIYLAAFNRSATAFFSKRVRHLVVLPEEIRNRLVQLLEAVRYYDGLPARTTLRLWALTGAGEFIGVGSYYCFVWSLGLNVSLISLIWIRSLSLLIGMVPISFSGLGVRDGTLIYLLDPYGVPASSAVSLSFLLFGRMALAGALGGLLEARHHFAGPPIQGRGAESR